MAARQYHSIRRRFNLTSTQTYKVRIALSGRSAYPSQAIAPYVIFANNCCKAIDNFGCNPTFRQFNLL
jgi:hypothetical protein